MPADRSTASSEDHPVRSESIVTDIQTIYFLIAAAGSRRVGGRSGSQPSLHLPLPSTCARPFRRAPRLDRARTPKSSTEEAAAAAATEATCARHRRRMRRCARVRLCVPRGGGAGSTPPASPTPRRGRARRLSGCLAPMRRPAPAADPPGCLGGVRRWRPRFPLTGSGCVSGACVPRASFSASAAGCRVQSASVCRVSE